MIFGLHILIFPVENVVLTVLFFFKIYFKSSVQLFLRAQLRIKLCAPRLHTDLLTRQYFPCHLNVVLWRSEVPEIYSCKDLLTFIKTNRLFPRVDLAKSILPPSVATFRNFLKSLNLCWRFSFTVPNAISFATAR